MEKTAGSGRTLTLLERMETAEQTLSMHSRGFEGLSESTEKGMAQLRGAMQNMVEVLNAVIKLQGEGFEARIQEEIVAARAIRAKEQLEKAQSVLANLVANKVLVASDVITENCLIVGHEADAHGAPVGIGTKQVELTAFNPAAQAALLGKGVGEKYTSEDGSFEVTGIYVPNPTPAPATEVNP